MAVTLACIRRAISPYRAYRFGRVVYETVGFRCMIMLVSTFLFLKGVLDSLSIGVLLPYFHELRHDGVAYQRTMALALVPYGMKGFIGCLSDALPICGYHKRYYMLLSNIVGIGCVTGLLVLPHELASGTIVFISLFYMGIHLQIATIDLLCEGVYCKIVRDNTERGPKLIGFVIFCNSMGHLIGNTVVGPVSDRFGTRPLLIAFLPLVMQSLIPVSFNFLREPTAKEEATPTAKPQQRKGIMTVAVLTSGCSCLALVLTICDWMDHTLTYVVLVSVVLAVSFCMLLNRKLALAAMFFFTDRVLHLTISGAVTFFLTADSDCVPNGPHFDYTYVCTYAAIVGAGGCISGIYSFQRWFKGWSARSVFWLMNCLKVLSSMFDYVIVRRLNVRLGIPDSLMYMVGDSVLYHWLLTVTNMTSSLTIARSCPNRLESTVYAIVSGATSLGNACSRLLGALAIEAAGIESGGEGACNFKALPNLILLCHCLLPLLCVPLAFFMLPKEPMDSAVESEGSKTAKEIDIPDDGPPPTDAENSTGSQRSVSAHQTVSPIASSPLSLSRLNSPDMADEVSAHAEETKLPCQSGAAC